MQRSVGGGCRVLRYAEGATLDGLLGQGILQDPVLHFTVVQLNLGIMNGLSSAPQTNH